MRALFCFDGPIFINKNEYYSISLTDKVISRYQYLAEEITIAIRVKEIDYQNTINRYSKITLDNVNVRRIPNVSSIKGQMLDKQEAKKILYKEVSECELVIARIPSQIGIMAIDLARKLNKPYIIEVVTCPWDAYWNHSLKGKMIAPIMYQTTKKRVSDAKYVTYVSQRFLQERYPSNGEILSLSDVELGSLDENKLHNRIKKINEKSFDQPITLGTVASVEVSYKGQHYVMQAISKLKKNGYNFIYYLVGGGNQKKLKKIAEKYDVLDNVEFIGPLAHEKIFEFMEQIDIYIQPSDAESHGRVIVEAMTTACPIIGSSTGGIPELVSDRFVFRRKNVEDLTEKLISMDKMAMLEEAKRNFEKAKEFEESVLDQKREKFYSKFAYQNF